MLNYVQYSAKMLILSQTKYIFLLVKSLPTLLPASESESDWYSASVKGDCYAVTVTSAGFIKTTVTVLQIHVIWIWLTRQMNLFSSLYPVLLPIDKGFYCSSSNFCGIVGCKNVWLIYMSIIETWNLIFLLPLWLSLFVACKAALLPTTSLPINNGYRYSVYTHIVQTGKRQYSLGVILFLFFTFLVKKHWQFTYSTATKYKFYSFTALLLLLSGSHNKHPILLPTAWIIIVISDKIMFSVAFTFVCLLPACLSLHMFACVFVSNITQNVMHGLWWNFMEEARVVKGTSVFFGGEPAHDPAFMEDCTLWVLGNWWLSVDIWWQKSVTRRLTPNFNPGNTEVMSCLLEICFSECSCSSYGKLQRFITQR